MESDFDVVIIGSGGGGAPIAHELVNAGHSVLVIEKGPLLKPQYLAKDGLSDFKRDELVSTGVEKRIELDVVNRGAAYYSSHIEPDINDEPHVYRSFDGQDKATIEGYTAQVVGGGTQLYGGVSYRYTARDMRLASANQGRKLLTDPNGDVNREARDWPFTYDDLEPYYAKAETLVGINGQVAGQIKDFKGKDCYQKPLSPNPISAHVERGMDALGMTRYRTPLAVITEDHAPSGRKGPQPRESAKAAYVNRYGDPLGFKSSAYVSLLVPIIPKPNFELRTNCTVTHLSSNDRKVTAVNYRDPAGASRAVTGKIVIVACSAIESVRLLKLSARQDPAFEKAINQDGNGMLGAYFLTHCFGGASALVSKPERYDKSLTLDSDWSSDFGATDDFIDSHGLWAGAAIYNNTSDRALPLSLGRNYGSRDLDTVWQAFVDNAGMTGEALDDFLNESFGRGLSMTFMANQVPMKTNRIELHPTVKDKWGRAAAYIIKGWHPHDVALMNTYAQICHDVLEKGGVTNQLGAGGVFGNDDLARCANHILGGARFGKDPKDSVLDPGCRAWGFDNLYVTDGAWMPTSGGGNPTLTIQANSFRVADILKSRI